MTSRVPFTLGDAAKIIGSGSSLLDSAARPLPRFFRTDSRDVAPGDGFIAIKGSKEDGHDYIAKASQAGASCVLVSAEQFKARESEFASLGIPLIASEDVTLGAAKLARAWLDEVSPKVIGITGSVGKTTTREFVAAALRGAFKTHSAIKSYNTMIGTSITVLSMPPDTDVLVLELGANHPGEIGEMARQFPVTHGVITDVADAHLEGLGNIGGVLAAKMEITESPSLQYLSYNSDNEILSAAVEKMPCGERIRKDGVRQIGVGYSNSGVRVADVRQSVSPELIPELFVTLSRGDRKLLCRAPVFGKQHAKNIGFAYAISGQAGLSDDDFVRAAGTFAVPGGRGNLRRGVNGCVLIDETYNASPSSVSCAIKNLTQAEIPGDLRRVAILGGMRELGAEAGRLHEVVLSRASLLDEVYLIGDEWRGAKGTPDSVRGIWPSADALAGEVDLGGFGGSAILIKGSRFYGMERLLKRMGDENAD
jgi:UDP-N-acetylmuramoyl-tripeptide--D-alanyl-D-alanine ligase